MIGVLNINKPKNVTSSQVVVKIKRLLNTSKVGHMGTLDPLASGVLPICVGKATRLFDYFLKKKKTYIARFTFGTQTDTLDLEGKVVKTSSNTPTKMQVENVLKTFIGEIDQIPPMYSSKKIDGKKAYNLARNGVELSLRPCKVTIYEYKLINQIDEKTFEFQITCSAGTYIRALARDLGEKLNSCATMTSLLRTASGNFKLEDSINFEDLTANKLLDNLIPLTQVLADFEKLAISKQNFQKLLNGLAVNIQDISTLIFNKDSNRIKSLKNKEQLINCNQNNTNKNETKMEQRICSILKANETVSQMKYYAVTVNNEIVGIGYIYNNNLKMKTYLLDN